MPVNSWHGGDHRPRASADTRGNPPQPKRPHPQLRKSKARSSGACGLWPLVPPCLARHFCQDVTACGGTRAQLQRPLSMDEVRWRESCARRKESPPRVLALRGRPCPCVRTCLRFLASLPQSVVTHVCQTGAGRCSTPLFVNISLYFLPWLLCVKYKNLFSFPVIICIYSGFVFSPHLSNG